MTATVLSVASRAVLEACEALKLDSDGILEQVGISRSVVDAPDSRLSTDQADAIWVAAYAASHDPDLALHAAEALPFGAYRVLDFIVANAPTVAMGLERLARYFVIVDQRAVLVRTGQSYKLESTVGPLPAAAQQYTLAAIICRLRACIGNAAPLKEVSFTFPEPKDRSSYRRIFQCPLRFQARSAALAFERTTLSAPIPNANEALASVLLSHAQLLVNALPQSGTTACDRLQARLRRALGEELRGGDISAGHIAQRLGLSERTLQRRLNEAGTTFAQILSSERAHLAQQYLVNREVSLTEVAFLLGFSEQSAFTRAFRRWKGMSPSAWRARAESA